MGKDFRIIFICGFVMCIINLVYALMGILYFMWDSKQVMKFAQCLAFLSGLLYIGWIVYASIIIFSDASDECGDTYLPQSRKFILVWLIISYCALGVLCCVACMLVCIVANNRKKKKQKAGVING